MFRLRIFRGIIVLLVIGLYKCIIPLQFFAAEIDSEEQAFQEAHFNYGKRREKNAERKLILESFRANSLIIRAFEKSGCDIFEVAAFLNAYGGNNFNGFCSYLKNQYPFNTKQLGWLKRNIFIPAKRNYKLLLKMEEYK